MLAVGACERIELSLDSFLTSALDRGDWSASHLKYFNPREIILIALGTGDCVGLRVRLDALVTRNISCFC